MIVIAILLAANVTARHLDEPMERLGLYAIALGLLVSIERLQRALPRVLLGLLLGAAGLFLVRNHAAIRSGDVSPGTAAEGILRTATGLHLRQDIRAALVDRGQRPSLRHYDRYLDKIDSRSSEINILAAHLANVCASADHLCEAATILRFVADEVAYRLDPKGGPDYVKTPQETLAANAGDCEDKTILLISLVQTLGIDAYMAFTDSHAYPLVCFGQPIEELIEGRLERLDTAARTGYLRQLSPRNDEREVEALLRRAQALQLDQQFCYALEPTAAGSWFGVERKSEELVIAIDPITGRSVDLASPPEAPVPARGSRAERE